jgi:hypothetical protein
MPRYSNERKEAVLKKLLPSSGWANHTLAGLKKLHSVIAITMTIYFIN